ncbi:Ada metal-binding domain-containing protein [Mucilaginibacter segetis]|uniref:Metal-binding protein n=1 Tax=Mucilaginibacter segetis TaxID=2793071 RepID=A0A934PX77_9SPHI|nr:Ada metal-binding domain-containing protein [Mucilaginibacter segetis]MBK0380756.1 metal-binding protein [Mucilaginibacter segetis]
MIAHTELGNNLFGRARQLKYKLTNGEIRFAGNRKLKIYGTLQCTSGKRMKAANRIFFISETEALNNGYRPCGHCMKVKFLIWKRLNV